MSRLPLVMGLMFMALMMSSCGQHRSAGFTISSSDSTESLSHELSEATIVHNWQSCSGKQVNGYDVFLTDGNRRILEPNFSATYNENKLIVDVNNTSSIRGVFIRWQQDEKAIKSVKSSDNTLLEYISPDRYAVAGIQRGSSIIVFDTLNTSTKRNLSAIVNKVETLNVFNTGRKNEFLLFWMQRLAGDCNNNNEVDFADFGSISAFYKQKVPDIYGLKLNQLDPNGNGIVDFADFGVIGCNYGLKLNGYRVYATTKSETQQSVSNVYQPVTDLLKGWDKDQKYFMQIINLSDELSTPLSVAPIFNDSIGALSNAEEPINSIWLPTVLGGTTLNANAQTQRRVALSWSAIQMPDFTNDGKIDKLDFAEIDKSILSSTSTLPLASDYLKLFVGKTGQDAFMDYHSIFSQIGNEPRASVLPEMYRVLAMIYQEHSNWSTNIYRFGPEPNDAVPIAKRIGQTSSNSFEDLAPSEGEARYLILPDPIADLFTYVQNQYISALPVTIRNY